MRFATEIAFFTTLFRMMPVALCVSATSKASLIWPRICDSPTIMESRLEATRNKWLIARSPSCQYRWGVSCSEDSDRWASARNSWIRPYPDSISSTTAYTSTRLQVDSTMPSRTPRYEQRRAKASPIRLSGTASFSRISTGAVLWLKPTTTMCISRHRSVTLEDHANESQNNPGKSDNCQVRRSFGPPAHRQASQQHGKVENPRHQGPCLLGVPVQIRAPRKLSGQRTSNDAKRK